MLNPQSPNPVPTDLAKPDLANDIRQLVGKADTLFKDAVKTGNEELSQARAQLEAKICTAQNDLQETAARLTDKAKLASVNAQKFVIENPWKSLGIMTLVGVVIGAFRPRR